MRHHVRMVGFLVGVLAVAFELQSCVSGADDCMQNSQCVNGNVPTGGGGAGTAGGTTTGSGCESDCDDGNPCTDDRCASGHCENTPVADGTPVTDSPCYACQDGNAAPAGAGTLCGGDQVCDGAGTCAACSETNPCPGGYGCSSGTCIEDLGKECVNDAGCTGPGTTCTNNQCCLVDCLECMRCNSVGFASCEPVPQNEYHVACTEVSGSACDGQGNCRLDIGQPCSAHSDCASGRCTGGNCTP